MLSFSQNEFHTLTDRRTDTRKKIRLIKFARLGNRNLRNLSNEKKYFVLFHYNKQCIRITRKNRITIRMRASPRQFLTKNDVVVVHFFKKT